MAHRDDAGDGETTDARRERTERFAALVRAGKHAELIEAAVQEALAACGERRSLAPEIGALRLMLQRIIAVDLLDGDPREATQLVTRLVDTIVRTLRADQTLATGRPDELQAALDRAFIRRGWKEAP